MRNVQWILTAFLCFASSLKSDEAYLSIAVNARHLNYTTISHLIQSCAKHPKDLSKNGDVGHAWIILTGTYKGTPIFFEGGHSGELGLDVPCYFEGVLECMRPENPISYLWESLPDGFLQKGAGGHTPTLVAMKPLTQEEFESIYRYLANYDFNTYSLTTHQCVSFVEAIASLAGIELYTTVSVPIPPFILIKGNPFLLWQDTCYAKLTFPSPDILEKCLKEKIASGELLPATRWYQRTHPKCLHQSCSNMIESLSMLKMRLAKLRWANSIETPSSNHIKQDM